MHRVVSILVVFTLVSSSGCYATFGTSPPAHPRAGAACTRSRALPIIDTVLAADGAAGVALGLLALGAVRDDGSLPAGEARATGTLFLITGLGMLIGNGLSARRGFRAVARCRAADGAPPPPPPSAGPPGLSGGAAVASPG